MRQRRASQNERERDFLHIYHYNRGHSSEYHSYDNTYKFTILISRLLYFYYIWLCGTPRWPNTLAYNPQCMRNVVIAHDLLLSSPFPTSGSYSFSHCQMGPTVREAMGPTYGEGRREEKIAGNHDISN